MARIIGVGAAGVQRLQSGTLGTSQVLEAHLRAAAERLAHPIDTGQGATTAAPATSTAGIDSARAVGGEGATPDASRTEGGRGTREPTGRPVA